MDEPGRLIGDITIDGEPVPPPSSDELREAYREARERAAQQPDTTTEEDEG